ncbi:MAG: chorismate synthase [Calditrichaeota bacterium]|nr:MAG: chorismate synthase [Calditrichota bacterium]
MIRFLTAGESHGPALSAIIEGMPAHLPIDINEINRQMKRRQQGFGRGGRMKMETDQIEILSGIRFGKTIASPISFILRNKDWENWTEQMAIVDGQPGREITKPRPGHADLSGAHKYDFDDMRNVLERSSARETAMRVAVGAFVRQFLDKLNRRIYSHILQIGKIQADRKKIAEIVKTDQINELADASEVRCLDKEATARMIEHITEIKRNGDTVGGIAEVIIRNAPPGLGSYVHWDRKLDALLAGAIMSIQAVKGVQIGDGFGAAEKPGSEFQDEIFYDAGRFYHKTNRCGGIEGGMSNGEDIIVRFMKKPIPTLMKPLKSVDIKTKEAFQAHKERSDVTALPAAAVIAEHVAAVVIANAIMDKFGGDTIMEIESALLKYRNRINK